MKLIIDSTILEEDDITMQEFSVILYYLSGGTGTIHEELCSNLREKGFLKRVVDGYQFHEGKKSKIKTWIVKSSNSLEAIDRFTSLAKAMQSIYPTGKKMGTNDYWRDSTKVIAQRLAMFFKKYGDKPDKEIINATRSYVESFNGEYQYMRLLKYFIYKKEGGDEVSPLASCLDNAGQEDTENLNWRDSVR